MAQSDPKKLLEKNRQLIHSEQQKVVYPDIELMTTYQLKLFKEAQASYQQ